MEKSQKLASKIYNFCKENSCHGGVVRVNINGEIFESEKQVFKRLSKNLFKSLAADLGIDKDNYEIKFIAGGDSVEPDTVFSNGLFEVWLSPHVKNLGILYRIKYVDAYGKWHSGQNRWLPWENLNDINILTEKLRKSLT